MKIQELQNLQDTVLDSLCANFAVQSADYGCTVQLENGRLVVRLSDPARVLAAAQQRSFENQISTFVLQNFGNEVRVAPFSEPEPAGIFTHELVCEN